MVRKSGWISGVMVAVVVGVLGWSGAGRAALPDGRRWEMVTPLEKNGGDVLLDTTEVQAAAEGDAVEFASLSSFGDAVGNSLMTQYVGVRGSSGWVVHAITPPEQPLTLREFVFHGLIAMYQGELSANLDRGVVLSKSPLTDAPNVASLQNLYVRTNLLTPGPGAYQLVSDAATGQPQTFFDPHFAKLAGASADFSHVLFEAHQNLTLNAAGLDPTATKAYEWVNGTVRLIGILPATEGGGPAPTSVAGQGAMTRNLTTGAISQDGSRVVFTIPASTSCAGLGICGSLYVRDDHGTASTGDDTTVPIAGAGSPATFWGASSGVDAQGDRVPWKVYFTTAEALTGDDTNGLSDLYVWSEQPDAQGHHLTRLSIDTAPPDDDVNAEGVIGASKDGSYVYFIGTGGQLDPNGPPAVGADARIYVWHDGTIREIGGVNRGGELVDLLAAAQFPNGPKLARVTPDGRHLIFMTEGTNELTGYDQGHVCDGLVSNACSEVYLYDATANHGVGKLSCVSCDPSGQAATTPATFVANFTPLSPVSHQNHAVSDDGRFVFFTSAERLVPEDVNGQADAYEYDANTGLLHLISSGTSPAPSAFLDASADGSNVFFATRQQLVSADTDDSYDIYDARINGFTDTPATTPEPCGSLDACRGSAPAPSAPRMAGSEAFLGPRNILQTFGGPPVFQALPLTAAQKRALVLGKRVRLVVIASQDGQLTATLQARIGRHTRVIATSTKTLTIGGQAQLTLKLNRTARQALHHSHRLHLTITIDYSRTTHPQRLGLTLHT